MSNQIKYISGIRMSKTVLTKYIKGQYNDEQLIKHLAKYNEDRFHLIDTNKHKSFESLVRGQLDYYNFEYDTMTNEDKAKALLGSFRADSMWKEEKDKYVASLEQTFDQLDNNVKRKIYRKFGSDINWDQASYDEDSGTVLINNNGMILSLKINQHKAGEYDEDSLTWTILK